jgi:hypothetical protein
MKKMILFFLLLSNTLLAQDEQVVVDEHYLEDQLYVSLSYQRLMNLPDEIGQSGFSYSLSLGLIKDIPINNQRNRGFGIGLGYNLNVHYFNVEDIGDVEDSNEIKSNKVALSMIEMPIEFRFRNSTPVKYKFWRFYPGIKLSYSFYDSNNIKQSEDFDVSEVIQINDFQYGVSLSAGYNNWNFYTYYGISTLFNESKSYPNEIEANEIKLGIIFYLL